jgi:hypothetical protein
MGRQGAPDFQEDILSRIFRSGFIAEQAEGKPKHLLSEVFQQQFERFAVALRLQMVLDIVFHRDRLDTAPTAFGFQKLFETIFTLAELQRQTANPGYPEAPPQKN